MTSFQQLCISTANRRSQLRLFLRSMLFQNDAAYSSGGESLFLLGQPMKMAAVMMAIIPIMCISIFQKYFTTGMTAGADQG